MHKWFSPIEKGAARTLDKKYILMTFPPEPLVQIQNNFTKLFLMIASPKIAQSSFVVVDFLFIVTPIVIVIDLCFVVRYFMSILVLQLS